MGKTKRNERKEDIRVDFDVDEVYIRMKDKVLTAVKNMGYDLVSFSIKKGKKVLVEVEIYLKDRSISTRDCEKVSNVISRLFDVEDPIPISYTLLVSSPGLDRELKELRDFEIFSGKEVEVNVRNFEVYALSSSHNVMRIIGVEGDVVKFDLGGKEVWIDFSDIEKAKLYFDFDRYFGGEGNL